MYQQKQTVMKTSITLQDLKDNKKSILDYCSFYTDVPAKELMQFMLDLVNDNSAEIGKGETFEDFISFCYGFLKPRSRKTTQMAERQAELVFQGKTQEFDTKKYWNNKLS